MNYIDESKFLLKNAKGHTWKLTEGGLVDIFAYSVDDDGYHSGPVCTTCGYCYCNYCHPNGPSVSCDTSKGTVKEVSSIMKNESILSIYMAHIEGQLSAYKDMHDRIVGLSMEEIMIYIDENLIKFKSALASAKSL